MDTKTKVEPLEITDDRDAQVRAGSWATYGSLSAKRRQRPFFIEVTGANFNATFDATPDDLRDIRDWINSVLED